MLCFLSTGSVFAEFILGSGAKGTAPVAYWDFEETSGTTVYDKSGNNHGSRSWGDYGTADTGTTTTIVKETAPDWQLSYSNDYYNGWTFEATSGPAQGQTATVTDFVVASGQNDKSIYLSAALTGFAAGHNYHIYKNTGMATLSASGKYGSAMKFDGYDDYVNLGSAAPALSEISGNKLTITAWVYPESGTGTIITKNGPLHIRLTGNRLYAAILAPGWQNVTGNINIPLNQWTHVAVVYDGSYTRLYVNGVFDNSMAQSGNLGGDGWTQIGRNNNGGANGNPTDYFKGLIDELKIYNRALTVDEINMEYDSGSSVHLGSSSSGTYDPWGGNPPIAWWSFDENSGTIAYDRSGNSNNGTVSNAAWAHGKHGNALSFDGDGDYVSVSSISTARTQEAWVYITEQASVKGDRNYLFSNFYQHYANNYFYFEGTADLINWLPSINTWYHLALTYTDPANTNTAKLYVNGVPYNVTQQSSLHDIDPITSISFSLANNAFKGLIDDVRIYDYVRTPAQIAWDYNKGKPVGHWNMDEATSGSAVGSGNIKDSSGQGNNGSGAGSNIAWTTGKYGGALSFNGTSDYVNVGDPGTGALDFGVGDFSLSAWFYLSSLPAEWKSIINKGSAGSTGYGMEINSSNYFTCSIQAAGGTNQHVAGSIPTTGSWHHGACVFDRDNNIAVYLDGKQVQSSGYASGNTNSVDTGSAFNIGRHTGGSWYFNGNIDDARAYNYARTADQIKEDYNEGASVRLGN